MVANVASELVGVLRVDVEGDRLPSPSYNVAPTDRVAIVLDSAKTDPPTRRLEAARWGLIPSWAKDPRVGVRAINARSEDAENKPTFRQALVSRRAVVPTSGYYEWLTQNGEKTPYFIRPADQRPLFLAGLYEWWRDPACAENDPQRWVLSFTVMTRAATGDLRDIHDRMPVFVDEDFADAWLDTEAENVGDLLDAVRDAAPDRADQLVAAEVGRGVGNVRNNDASLIVAVAEPGASART